VGRFGDQIVRAVPTLREPVRGLIVGDEVAPERGRDRLHRHVVVRRSEPAGDEHGVVLGVVFVDDARDLGDLVGDDRYPADRHAAVGEPAAKPRRVRVLGITDEEFVPDGDNCGVHTRTRRRALKRAPVRKAKLPTEGELFVVLVVFVHAETHLPASLAKLLQLSPEVDRPDDGGDRGDHEGSPEDEQIGLAVRLTTTDPLVTESHVI